MPRFTETKYATNASWDFGVSNLAIVVDPDDGNIKLAAEDNGSESLHYATTQLKPQPNKTYIIVIAMGASDSYGPNRNADGFTRSMLHRCHPSFEDYANVFVNHKNKDPEKSVGEIIRSFYNKTMDRVELLLALFNDKAGRYIQKIHDKRIVPVSMGLHIPGDNCSVCNHFAPIIKKHCIHMKKGGQFGPSTMYYVSKDENRRYPEKDGTLIYVDNPSGRFFDLSLVPKPADMIANPIYWPSSFMRDDTPEKVAAVLIAHGYDDEYVMQQMKLAENAASRYADIDDGPRADLFDVRRRDPAKLADMIKRIDGIAGDLDAFKKDPKFISEKKAQLIVRGGVSSISDFLRRADVEVSFPETYKLAHMALFGSDVTDLDIKMASLYQREFVTTMQESPALSTFLKTSLSLDDQADLRHVSHARGMQDSGLSTKLASVEHSNVSRKQKALCGFVAANIFLEQKVGVAQIARGRVLSSDITSKRDVSTARNQSIEIVDKPSTVLRSLSTSFGDIIF